jgi:hypothetical protein
MTPLVFLYKMTAPYSEILENAHRMLSAGEDTLPTRNMPVTPASPLAGLVRTYQKRAFDDPSQMRAYATNRLLELTDHDDARIQLKAIELLGKVADIGLFADRTEITIKDKTTKDLEKELEAYFAKYVKDITPREITDVE